MARDLGDRHSAATTYWNLMLLERSLGNTEQAVAYGEQALAIARTLPRETCWD